MRLNKETGSSCSLFNPLCDQELTSLSCSRAVWMHGCQSICLFCWPFNTLQPCSVCVWVCLQLTPQLIPSFFFPPPDFPLVKSIGCVLTCSSLFPLLNLFFMLPSLILMGLSVCLSVSGSHPYQASTKMTFWALRAENARIFIILNHHLPPVLCQNFPQITTLNYLVCVISLLCGTILV